uniref:Importin N-terminal domain-containing protein n=1 Tax=Syphacia muris TaxID=451379 RepID=A0A0N5AV98_9BILA
MAQPELLQILEKTSSQNPDDQKLALDFLNQACHTNFPEFIKQLSLALVTGSCSNFVRRAAGLQLKNVLVAKEEATKNDYLNRWLALPEDVRQFIKGNVMQTLGTEPFRPSVAAQCVAAIACAEIPQSLWPNVIQQLMQNVTNSVASESLKESSLEALGYICQDINASTLESQANLILTAIVKGLSKDEPSYHVRFAAANAMLNSLEFTKNNFSIENERNLLMQVICEASQCPEIPVRVVAMQCLVRIMSLYYQYMEHYMNLALFSITLNAMKMEIDEVALQGIEFWSNVCEEEITLAVEAEEAQEQGRTPENISRHYAKGALSYLVPILTETLARQEETDDDDDWNPAKAAGVCIMLLAQCTGDSIVSIILPFIQEHFKNTNWRYRDAAIMAFGSILDGPDQKVLTQLVESAISSLIEALADTQLQVRDTAAWCIGRVCDSCEEVVTRQDILLLLLPALSSTLQQEPRVAANVCWAISSLAKASYDVACRQGTDESGEPESYILSPCFEGMINELIKATDRTDANVSNLRIAAFETLMELIKNSPKDCYEVVQKTTLIVLKKLEQLLNMETSLEASSHKSQLRDLESLLCATLQSVLRKIRSEDIPYIGDAIMSGLIQIMQRCVGKESGGVMEDALMAVSTLIEALGNGFVNYMEAFKPYLVAGLRNHEEAQVCSAAIGVLADLCRALEAGLMPYLDEFMELLSQIVQSERINRDVKPTVLSCFGDIALAIGSEFSRYFETVVQFLLMAASSAKVVPSDDYDKIEYVEQLQESCVEAYTGIIQGVKGSERDLQLLLQHVPAILLLVNNIASGESPESLIGAASGFSELVVYNLGIVLIGDLVTAFGAVVLPSVDNHNVSAMLTRGRRSKSARTKSLAVWATKEIRKLKAVPST